MKKYLSLFISLLLLSIFCNVNAQNVGIGTTQPSGKFTVYGMERTDVTIRTSDNSQSQGIAYQNSGGSYTWNIYRQTSTGNYADLVFANGLENDITDLTPVMTVLNGGGLDLHSFKLFNLADPTGAQDAATKAYVDAAILSADDGDWVPVGSDIQRPSGDVYIGSSSSSTNSLYFGYRLVDWDNTDYYLNPNDISYMYLLDVNEVYADLGSASDVSYTFDGDDNTGMWSPGADLLGFSTGGTEAFRVDDAQNIGIGETLPAARLHVTTDNSVTTYSMIVESDNGSMQVNDFAHLLLQNKSASTTNFFGISNRTNGQLDIAYGAPGSNGVVDVASSIITLETNGNVGIGTNDAQAKLDVAGNANIGSAISSNTNTNSNILNMLIGVNGDGGTNGISFFESSSNGFAMKMGYDGLGSGSANAIRFYDDADDPLVSIENGGDVQIHGLAGSGERVVTVDDNGVLNTDKTMFAFSGNIVSSPDDFSGSGQLTGDESTVITSLGFDWVCDGVTYSYVQLSTNGWITFLTSNSSSYGADNSNECLPTNDFDTPTIFAYWDNIETEDDAGDPGDDMRYKTIGTSPNRVFVVDCEMRDDDDNYDVTYQVSIHETSGLVQVNYRYDIHHEVSGQSATIGFQTAGGSSARAFPVSCNASVLDDNNEKDGTMAWSIAPVR